MRLILDASALDLYKGWSRENAFHGGTETYVKVLAKGLAHLGHTVHVVTGDVARDEQRGDRETWWPLSNHPTQADCVVAFHNLEGLLKADYVAPLLVLATNGIDPWLPDSDSSHTVDAYPVFSQTHADLLCKARPTVDREKCFVTGLGVSLDDYDRLPVKDIAFPFGQSIPGRIFVGNDPQRGLWHVLDIFDELKKLVPEATLHVAYDFDRVFEQMKWQASAAAQMLWDCKERLSGTDGVKNLGALTREQVIQEQFECQVHVWPSDPPNVGSQIHGLTQMECAAAGAALVLSDIEAFPEVFGSAATLLPVPGTYLPALERRWNATDWAEVVAELMTDRDKWAEASRKSRTLAQQHTWQHVIDRWEAMFQSLADGLRSASTEAVAV